VPNSLDLDEEWGGEELVLELERAFAVAFSNEEVEHLGTVGGLHDLLIAKIPPNDGDTKCVTAMAFYRLRRALRRLGHDGRIAPATDVLRLERGTLKSSLRELERESGLRLPLAAITPAAAMASLGCFVAAIAGAVLIPTSLPSAVVGALSGLMAACALVYFDAGRFPADCATLGGLAKRTAALNYGDLVQRGARHGDDDIWDVLLTLLPDHNLPKAEVTRETCFFHGQLKKPR
jgi:hypothetical protein